MDEISAIDVERRVNFMLVEHSCLQENIRHAATDLYRTETITPIAIALTYAWLYGGETGIRDVPYWMWWVPVVLVGFGAYRQRLRYKSLWASHEYVQSIEKQFYGEMPKPDDPRPFGWESHWLADANRFHNLFGREVSSHALMRILFWLVLLAGTTALAIQETPW